MSNGRRMIKAGSVQMDGQGAIAEAKYRFGRKADKSALLARMKQALVARSPRIAPKPKP